jgi:hypothetical protein
VNPIPLRLLNDWITARHGLAHETAVATHNWNPDPGLRRIGTYCRACGCGEDDKAARVDCSGKRAA